MADEQTRTVILQDKILREFDGGFTAIPNRILENNGLSLGARMAYAMLLKYAWQKDFCFPAQERIAVDLGVTDRSVRTFLKELRDKDLITWKQQGLNRPNIYYILRLPDRGPQYPGPENISGPVRKQASGQDRKQASDKEYSKKKTQNTRVSGFAVSGKEGRDPARELASHFHELAGHPATQKPLAKEFRQAADLIAEHGEETARWIVEFALQKAPETNYRPRHLGAVLSFVSDALIARQGHLENERRREERERTERERQKQLEIERAAYAALSPEERLERDFERWRIFFPALHKNREPNEIEVASKRRELALQYGLDLEPAVPQSLSA